MKRTKLLSLVALLLIASMLFVACGDDATEGALSKASSFDKILNPNYNLTADEMTSASSIDGIDGYVFAESTNDFAVFTKDSYETYERTTKVVSLRSGTVVLSITSSDLAQFSVSLSQYTPTFTVHKRYGEELDKDRYTLYDAAGNTIASQVNAITEPTVFADMILFNATLYEENDDGALVEVISIPENLTIKNPDEYSEKYFYFFTDSGVKVYDRSFNFKLTWDAPAGAEPVIDDDYTIVVLNDGNLLIQYAKQLESDTKKYDYLTEIDNEFVKYDLCTYVLNVETGKTKAVETSYVIYAWASEFEMNEYEDEGNSRYADSFENIAIVYPINDQRIDKNESDLVLVDNAGKVTASLKLADYQEASIPRKIADNTYSVSTEYGSALVNAKGETLLNIQNNSLRLVGSYIIGEKAIYNHKMEVVYNLSDNDAIIISTMSGSIYIEEEVNDSTYEVICLRDGELRSICTVDRYDVESNKFTVEYYYYSVYRSTTERYSYFNAMGDLLIANDTELTTVTTSSHGTCILKSADNEYYLLSK